MSKIIDLSICASNDTDGIDIKLQENRPVYAGHDCYAYDLDMKSHKGTYFESESHVFRDTPDTVDYALDDLILPGICLHLEPKENRCIDAAELESAAKNIDIKPGSALLFETKPSPGGFRYFSRDAADWMAEKKAKLMGGDTERFDSGFDSPTGFFINLFEAGIPIIANIINLEKLPSSGFTLYTIPLNIKGVCTVPCRVFAICE